MKFSFENLHANKTLAFIDGFGSGIICALIGKMFWDAYVEDRDLRRAAEESLAERELPKIDPK